MPPTHAVDHPGVIELRQYTLRPGRRDELIELFDREFVETQEETGMVVLGQFRDLDDPNRFVWLRGFRDMTARHHALTAFYGGPVWAEHGPRANATMIDSDDVLLLRPLSAGTGVTVSPPSGPGPAPRNRSVSWPPRCGPSRPDGTTAPTWSGTVSSRCSARRDPRRSPPWPPSPLPTRSPGCRSAPVRTWPWPDVVPGRERPPTASGRACATTPSSGTGS